MAGGPQSLCPFACAQATVSEQEMARRRVKKVSYMSGQNSHRTIHLVVSADGIRPSLQKTSGGTPESMERHPGVGHATLDQWRDTTLSPRFCEPWVKLKLTCPAMGLRHVEVVKALMRPLHARF